MAKIQSPNLSTELAGKPVLEGALRNLTNNLRSGEWVPNEIGNWGTGVTAQGRYQLIGNICFVSLWIHAPNGISVNGSTANQKLSPPVVPWAAGLHVSQYQAPVPEHTLNVSEGTAQIGVLTWTEKVPSDGKLCLTPPTLSGTGLHAYNISGWYWVKG